jgi:hypothetical protein
MGQTHALLRPLPDYFLAGAGATEETMQTHAPLDLVSVDQEQAVNGGRIIDNSANRRVVTVWGGSIATPTTRNTVTVAVTSPGATSEEPSGLVGQASRPVKQRARMGELM